jgi:hypothetical protein
VPARLSLGERTPEECAIGYDGASYEAACRAAGEALRQLGYAVVEVDLDLGLIVGNCGRGPWLVHVDPAPGRAAGTIQVLPGRVSDDAVIRFETYFARALEVLAAES